MASPSSHCRSLLANILANQAGELSPRHPTSAHTKYCCAATSAAGAAAATVPAVDEYHVPANDPPINVTNYMPRDSNSINSTLSRAFAWSLSTTLADVGSVHDLIL